MEAPLRLSEAPAAYSNAKTKDAVSRPTSKLRTDAKVRDIYKLGKTLGTGGFAIVKLATDKQTSEEYACKIMALPEESAKAGDNENTREDIFKEIDILVGLNHENVIFLKEYFEEGNKVYLITELLTGGELLDAVLERGSYNEADARYCFVQLLRGIEYLHTKNVVHRDLKLENLLLATPDDITKIKIADFGLAKKAAESAMDTICGTPQYVAPEVIQGIPGLIYNAAVDLWSAGVVLFILLGGYPPFYDESEPALFEQIRKGHYTFDDPVWDTITEPAKDLIRKLLAVDPRKRLTASQALKHKWITGTLDSTANLDLTRLNMRRTLRNKFKGAVHTIVAQNRLRDVAQMVKSGKAVRGETLLSDAQDVQRMADIVKRIELKDKK
ncbi:hypothetical protein WJX72_006277 [[Myrmecia] bisecta]|uniref:Protein kinase domain-containing protein n=1 Tax=[Myrmecia] bisecta TaxID=41462 RepID=A0AAW1QAQ2_9CHLO